MVSFLYSHSRMQKPQREDEEDEDDEEEREVFSMYGVAEWHAMRAHPLAKHVAEVHIAHNVEHGAKVCTQEDVHFLLHATPMHD